jgi:hypothetical protein
MQVRRKRAAIGATFLGASGRSDRVSPVVIGFGGGNGLLDVLKR